MSDPDLSFALASKNQVDAGTAAKPPKDVAEFVYSGNIASQKDVTIELFEVDTGESLSKKTKPGSKLATFVGDIAPVAAPASGKPPGALALTKTPSASLDDDVPRFQLKLAGQTFQIGLPQLDVEGGRRFEIELRASATPAAPPKPAGKGKGKGKGKAPAAPALKFVSKVLLFVRFGHFAKDPRAPVITFVTGAEDQNFFKAATVFWRQHADIVVERDGMSLEEIVAFLAGSKDRVLKESGNNGWGEVNIVCHGNAISAVIHILAGDAARDLRLTQLDKALANKPSAFSAGDLALRATSRVVFRACNIGGRADLLDAVRKQVFGDACVVKAPKFLQTYSAGPGSSPTRAAAESFTEEIRVHFPRSSAPSTPVAEAGLSGKFQRIQAKQPASKRLTFAQERPSFTNHPTTVVTNTAGFSGLDAGLFLDLDDASATTPDQVLKDTLDGQTDNFDFSDASRWQIGSVKTIKSTSQDLVEVVAQSSSADPGRAVGKQAIVGVSSRVTNTKASRPSGQFPVAIESSASGLTGEQDLLFASTSVAGVSITGNQGATFTVNKKSASTFTGSLPGTASITVTVGGETLLVTKAQKVDVELPISRFPVSIRRELRVVTDPKVPFDRRTPVVPDVDDSSHYGSSDDPTPSIDELQALAE